MPKATRVLIASASTGNGHLRAGDALLKALRLRRSDWLVEHVDVLTWTPAWVRLAYGGGFELLAAHAPRVWGGLYRWADGPDGDAAHWAGLAERTLFRSFRRLLHRGDWDLCICTHFLPAQLAAGRPGVPPFSLVITDLTLHRYWAQPRVTRYFAPNEVVAAGLRERFPAAHVDATGIPVDPAMFRRITKAAACESFGLDPSRPVLLLMAGGLGIGLEASLAAVLEAELRGAQVVVVCGHNLATQYRLTTAAAGPDLHVFGFVNNIERLMAAADLIITKPGGLTTAEALASGKPMLLTKGLPGHEAGNALTLAQMGAAISTNSLDELRDQLTRLMRHSDELAALRTSAAAADNNAGEAIAGLVESDLSRSVAA